VARVIPRSSRSSQNVRLQENAEGSVDVYFGPKSSAGMKFEKTWMLPVSRR